MPERGTHSSWRQDRLGAICQINPDKRDSAWPYEEMEYIDISSVGTGVLTTPPARILTAEAPSRAQRLVRPGDTILATVRPNLRSFVYLSEAKPNTVVSTGFAVLRACAESDQRFIYYVISHQSFTDYLAARAHGSAYPAVSADVIHNAVVHVPPSDVRRSIGAVLGALDDKIEQNRRTARALERLARAIFRAWFVDFEPAKAKAAGAAAFPSMPQEIFDALPTRFVDSEIGPVPEGWEMGALKDLAALSKTQVKPQEHPEEVFDHFSIPAFDAERRPVIEAGSAIKSNKFLVADGCVLLSKLNPRIPRIWLPPLARERRQIASTEFLVCEPNLASDRHYLYCQFQQTAFREELAQTATGTSNSHQRIKPTYLLAKAVILPSDPIREGFANLADPLFALAAANHLQSAMLAETRNYLLPKLLSGEVRAHRVTSVPEEVK